MYCVEKTMTQIFYIASLSPDDKGGIHQYELTSDLSIHETNFYPLANALWLAFNSERSVLYVSTSDPEIGTVHSYKINKESNPPTLELINSQKTGANCPCHLAVNSQNNFLYCANYGEDGNASFTFFPLQKSGFIEQPQNIIKYAGSGPNQNRQECSHIHCTYITPDGQHICVVDLGTDTIHVYALDFQSGINFTSEKVTKISMKPGEGPRHIIFDPKQEYAYVASELGNSVTSFRINKSDSGCGLSFDHVSTLSTLPEGFSGVSYVAAIKFSKNFDQLFVSNRGHESIACFSLDGKGGMTLKNIVSVGGKFPRDFDFFPNVDILAATNQLSNDVTFFKYDEGNCNLLHLDIKIDVLNPLCIAFPLI